MDDEKKTYVSVDWFDRRLGGLLGGNNIHTKATTLQTVELTKTETYIVQTIRVTGGEDEGEHVALQRIAQDEVIRLVLPPRVINTMLRQRDAVCNKARSNSSKAAMRERMAAGYVPTPPKRKAHKKQA